MKVSIVTISYNQAPFLEQALLSVIGQSYSDLEYIVVDPGSTDGSREIIEKYRPRIDHIIFEPDDGPADGLNKGFRRATGEIYGVVNADDALHPSAVTRFVKEFRSKKSSVISGHGYKIDQLGRVVGKIYSDRYDPLAYVYGVCVLVQQSTFFRADLFHRVGGFNISNKHCWDGELWFDFANHGATFGRISGYWSYFRVYPGSISASGQFRRESMATLERLGKKIGVDNTHNVLLKSWFWLKAKSLNPAVLIEKLRSRRRLA
jgi:glycosyltransferase involved in cell wall biosynthesis